MKMYDARDFPSNIITNICGRKKEPFQPKEMFYEKELLFTLRNNVLPFKTRRLLKRGTNPNVESEFGIRPLHIAVYRRLFSQTRLLISYGADINARDVWGRTVLHYAVSGSDSKIIRYLLEHGADPNLKDCEGKSPVDYASENGLLTIYIMLQDLEKDEGQSEETGLKLLSGPCGKEVIELPDNADERSGVEENRFHFIGDMELSGKNKRKVVWYMEVFDMNRGLAFRYDSTAKNLTVHHDQDGYRYFPDYIEKILSGKKNSFNVVFENVTYQVVVESELEVIRGERRKEKKVRLMTIWKLV